MGVKKRRSRIVRIPFWAKEPALFGPTPLRVETGRVSF
jgi:hypothetical protein